MSGSKVISVSGIAQTSATASTAGISGAMVAMGAATVVGLTALVTAAGIAVTLTGKAINAYQERVRQQKEAAEQREREIQQRIAEIRAQIRSRGGRSQVTVSLPVKNRVQDGVSHESLKTAALKDNQRLIDDLKSRLSSINAEYQVLIDQELLDRSTVDEALKKIKEALNNGNLAEAQGYLQALDDARIQVMQGLREQWVAQIEYLEQRLRGLHFRVPEVIFQELQTSIDGAKSNWQRLREADIEILHQRISVFEGQADSIQEAAEKLIASQRMVGYEAYLREFDNGDAVVEVETHEGVNTQIRVDFYGEQIALAGPPEEPHSCAARTVEAMRIFQEQGYRLEWTQWDGEPVAEELRHLYSVPSQTISESYQGGKERSERRSSYH